MTSDEITMTLIRASYSCGQSRCPYASQCTGRMDGCRMKEVALVIRSQMAQIETLEAKNRRLMDLVALLTRYNHDLEKINRNYFNLVKGFQSGYRNRKRILKRGRPIRIQKPPKDPVEMDGDERYAMPKDPDKQYSDRTVIL